MKGYDTAAYAATRLAETVIRLKGVPVLVTTCEQNGKNILVHYTHIMEDAPPSANVIEDFDLDPVPLGYVNFGGKASYISRMPMRKDWRQGMRMSNIVDTSGYNPTRMPLRVICQTIVGDFPSFDRAIAGVTRKSRAASSVAFHRDFAVTADGKLEYKGIVKAGEVNLEDASVSIPQNMNWIREAFAEAMETN